METSTTFTWNFSTDVDYTHHIEKDSLNMNGSQEDVYDDYTQSSYADFQEYKVAQFINEYYLYVVCAIGIPGNIACIVTLTSMRPILSSAIYMIALAIADLVALILKMIYLQLTAKDVRLGDKLCQIIFLIGTVSQMYANWILVALTIERFIAIWFPLKVRELCTRRNTIIALIIMLVFFILANLQFLFTFEEVYDPHMVYDCRPKTNFAEFIQFHWYWIDGVLYAILPIIFILTFNTLIIVKVRRSTRHQKTLTNSGVEQKDTPSYQRQITTMLFTASVIFIILILPNCIFFIAKEYWTWRETAIGIAQYYLMYQLVFLLSDLSHAVNFYLYCLSGRKFRKKFFRLLCSRCVNRDRLSALDRSKPYISRAMHCMIASSGTHVSAITPSPCVTPTKTFRELANEGIP